MASGFTTIVGLVIPSTSPAFLAVVGVHVLCALTAALSGLAAMLSPKKRGCHPRFGTLYFRALLAAFVTAAALAGARWREDYHLFVIGAAALAAATMARSAVRARGTYWPRWHAAGMSLSYLLLLIAFYVDNGHNLPVWRSLPPFAYWLIPTVIAVPLVARAYRLNPLLRAGG